MYNVLCLDGAHSCFQYMYQYLTLTKIQTKIRKFDLIICSGLSSILASILSLGKFGGVTENLAFQHMEFIFAEEELWSPWLKPKFKNTNKRKLLNELFGDICMSDINTVRFAIVLMDTSGILGM